MSAGPSLGTCSNPSNRQLNQDLRAGSNAPSAALNQNSTRPPGLGARFYPDASRPHSARVWTAVSSSDSDPGRAGINPSGRPQDERREGKHMAAILVLLLIAILFGLGFAVKALLFVAIALMVLWAIGFVAHGSGRRWYSW